MMTTPTLKRTASGKEQALVDFYRQLARDGFTVSRLADHVRIGRTTLSQMFHGKYTGRNSWKHVVPYLSDAALFHLRHCSAWNSHAEEALAIRRGYTVGNFHDGSDHPKSEGIFHPGP